jgi:hypothetical protein
MGSNERVSPTVDLIARVICVLVGAGLGAAAFIGHAGDGNPWLVGVLAAVSALALAAGTVGPRSVRLALVTWMPWF